MKHVLNIILAFAFFSVSAQKIKLVEGSLAPLKGETNINTEFSYENLVMGDGTPEQEYIDRKKKDYNEKEAGTGDKWEQAWTDDRPSRFEPKFNELFSEYAEILVTDNKAKYTLIYHTTKIEPGFNVGIVRRNAYTDAEVTIVETNNPNNVIARLTVLNSPGSAMFGMDFDTGVRISESYAKAGKSLGIFIKKNNKK